MSVIEVTLDWKGLEGGVSLNEYNNFSGNAKEIYQVTFDENDDPRDRGPLALNASGVPLYNAAHSADTAYKVRSKSYKAIGPCIYEVTVNYEYKGDPLLEPARIRFLSATAEEQVETDAEGTAYLNSSDEPFDPPPTRPFSDLVIRVTRNQATFDYNLIAQFKDALNLNAFMGYSSGKVRITEIDADESYDGTTLYYVCNYEFRCRDDGWEPQRLLDQGFREVIGGSYRTITDDDKNPLTQAALLNGSGQKLAPGSAPIYLEFKKYIKKDFSLLGF